MEYLSYLIWVSIDKYMVITMKISVAAISVCVGIKKITPTRLNLKNNAQKSFSTDLSTSKSKTRKIDFYGNEFFC